MEQYLRMFISYYQDNWPDWVALAEFVSNDTISTSITVTPFFANSGQHPRLDFKLSKPDNREALKANKFTTRMQSIEEILRSEMNFAQTKYKYYANRSRDPAPAY